MTPNMKTHLLWLCIVLVTVLCASCIDDPEVEDQPGIVRVVLTADPTDTQITILGQTLTVSDDPANLDSLGVNVFQGKAISEKTTGDGQNKFAILFESVHQYVQTQKVYNLLLRENGEYKKHVVFESFVPEGKYTGLSMGLDGLHMSIGVFEIPLELRPGADLVISLSANYEVFQRQVTEIRVELSPFKSMVRRLDAFVFDRISKISQVQVLGEAEFNKVVKDLPPIINPNDPFRP